MVPLAAMSPPDPDIAVVLCTLDRGPAIEATVASLLDQDLPRERFELLLVDNNSRPEDAALLRAIAAREAPTVRYVHEPVRGLSIARNRGIREATAPLVAFVDDDARVGRGWLAAYVAAFARDPEIWVLGGAVELQHEVPPPGWLEDWMLPYLGAFDFGTEPRRLSGLDTPRGGNVVFRREVFERVGGFSEQFGRKPGSLISLEEVEICHRVAQEGLGIGYIPDAKVVHLVEAHRWREGWFRKRLHAQGASLALFDRLHGGRLRLLWTWLGNLRRMLLRRGLRRAEPRGYVEQGLRLLFRGAPPAARGVSPTG